MPLSRPTASFLWSGSGTTARTSLTSAETAAASAGDYVVVIVGADNAGTSGTNPISSVTDSSGNTWTLLNSQTRSPTSTANDGVSVSVYGARFTATNNITITANFSTSVTSSGLQGYKFNSAQTASQRPVVAERSIAAGSATSATVTTSTLTNQYQLVGYTARETGLGQTSDSDTTNGTWSNALFVGSTSGGIRLYQQVKSVTGTGTQTYNISWTNSEDYVHGYFAVTNEWALTATGSGQGTETALVPPVSFTDNFTRADSTTSVGGDWVTTFGTLGITSNKAYMVSGGSGSSTFQSIQSSQFKQVVSAEMSNPSPYQTMILYIAYKDVNNWVRFAYFPGFATWVLQSNLAGVATSHGNTGLSSPIGTIQIARDGNSFTASCKDTAAGQYARTASFTITGFDYNGVGWGISTPGTTYTVDDFTARPLVTTTMTASSSGTGTQTAARVVLPGPKTATGTGTATQSAFGFVTRPRTATGTGVGTQYARWWDEILSTASNAALSGEFTASVITPILVAEGSVAAVTTGNLTVTLPSHQANDILVLTVVGWVPNTTTGTNLMSLAGWTQLYTQSVITGGVIDGEWAIWWKRAASSAETNPTITRPTSWDTGVDTAWAGRAYTIRNAITTGDPYDGAVESAVLTAANGSFPAVTVSNKGRSVYQFYVSSDNLSSGTAPSGWLANAEVTDNTGTDTGFRAFYQLGLEDSTSPIASTVTAPAQGGYVFFGVSFKPPVIVASVRATGFGYGYQSAVGAPTGGFNTVNRTATGSGTGTQSAARLVSRLRTGTGSGSGTQTASKVVTKLRTATGSGSGTQTAVGIEVLPRTAIGSGAGTQSASRVVVKLRTATGSGSGTQSAARLITRLRIAIGSGLGTQTATGITTIARTATGSGNGTQNAFGAAGTSAIGFGVGSSSATKLVVSIRTATGSGAGTQNSTQLRTVFSTAIGNGTGSESTTRVRIALRTALGSGGGTQTTVSFVSCFRTAIGSGTGTASALGAKIAQRTASNSATSSQTATAIFFEVFNRSATASALGASTTISQLARLRFANGLGISSDIATANRLKSIRVWSSGQWESNAPKIWDGSTWNNAQDIKQWDGNQWVNL